MKASHILAGLICCFGANLAQAQNANDAQNAAAGTAPNAAANPQATLGLESAFSNGIQREAGTIGATADNAASFSSIGSDAGGATGRGATGGAGGFGGAFGGAFNQLFGFGANNQSSSTKFLRTRLKSGIELPRQSVAARGSAIRSQINKLPVSSRMSGMTLSMSGRTAVLSGTVKNQKDKRLAEMLMKLEPGVSKVDNQLVVLESAPMPIDSVDSILQQQ